MRRLGETDNETHDCVRLHLKRFDGSVPVMVGDRFELIVVQRHGSEFWDGRSTSTPLYRLQPRSKSIALAQDTLYASAIALI
jgi:hypothetical protein